MNIHIYLGTYTSPLSSPVRVKNLTLRITVGSYAQCYIGNLPRLLHDGKIHFVVDGKDKVL